MRLGRLGLASKLLYTNGPNAKLNHETWLYMARFVNMLIILSTNYQNVLVDYHTVCISTAISLGNKKYIAIYITATSTYLYRWYQMLQLKT